MAINNIDLSNIVSGGKVKASDLNAALIELDNRTRALDSSGGSSSGGYYNIKSDTVSTAITKTEGSNGVYTFTLSPDTVKNNILVFSYNTYMYVTTGNVTTDVDITEATYIFPVDNNAPRYDWFIVNESKCAITIATNGTNSLNPTGVTLLPGEKKHVYTNNGNSIIEFDEISGGSIKVDVSDTTNDYVYISEKQCASNSEIIIEDSGNSPSNFRIILEYKGIKTWIVHNRTSDVSRLVIKLAEGQTVDDLYLPKSSRMLVHSNGTKLYAINEDIYKGLGGVLYKDLPNNTDPVVLDGNECIYQIIVFHSGDSHIYDVRLPSPSDLQRMWVLKNNHSHDILISCEQNPGAMVVIPPGKSKIVYTYLTSNMNNVGDVLENLDIDISSAFVETVMSDYSNKPSSTEYARNAFGGMTALALNTTTDEYYISEKDSCNAIIELSGVINNNKRVYLQPNDNMKRMWIIRNDTEWSATGVPPLPLPSTSTSTDTIDGVVTLYLKNQTSGGLTIPRGRRFLVYSNGVSLYSPMDLIDRSTGGYYAFELSTTADTENAIYASPYMLTESQSAYQIIKVKNTAQNGTIYLPYSIRRQWIIRNSGDQNLTVGYIQSTGKIAGTTITLFPDESRMIFATTYGIYDAIATAPLGSDSSAIATTAFVSNDNRYLTRISIGASAAFTLSRAAALSSHIIFEGTSGVNDSITYSLPTVTTGADTPIVYAGRQWTVHNKITVGSGKASTKIVFKLNSSSITIGVGKKCSIYSDGTSLFSPDDDLYNGSNKYSYINFENSTTKILSHDDVNCKIIKIGLNTTGSNTTPSGDLTLVFPNTVNGQWSITNTTMTRNIILRQTSSTNNSQYNSASVVMTPRSTHNIFTDDSGINSLVSTPNRDDNSNAIATTEFVNMQSGSFEITISSSTTKVLNLSEVSTDIIRFLSIEGLSSSTPVGVSIPRGVKREFLIQNDSDLDLKIMQVDNVNPNDDGVLVKRNSWAKITAVGNDVIDTIKEIFNVASTGSKSLAPIYAARAWARISINEFGMPVINSGQNIISVAVSPSNPASYTFMMDNAHPFVNFSVVATAGNDLLSSGNVIISEYTPDRSIIPNLTFTLNVASGTAPTFVPTHISVVVF